MAVFCTPWETQMLCPNLQRNYAIQRPFSSRTLSCTISMFGTSKSSILRPAEFNNRANFYSSLSSSSELDKGSPSTSIVFIKGLAQSSMEGRLKTAFSQFGEVNRVKVVNDKKTKQPLGFAYIWFTSEEHAQAAVEEMNGKFFDGRFIHVTIAKPGSCKPRQRATPFKF